MPKAKSSTTQRWVKHLETIQYTSKTMNSPASPQKIMYTNMFALKHAHTYISTCELKCTYVRANRETESETEREREKKNKKTNCMNSNFTS